MARTKSILKPKSAAKKSLSVKISPSLYERYADIEARVKSEAPEHTISLADIVEPALEEAISQIEKELDKMGKTAQPVVDDSATGFTGQM